MHILIVNDDGPPSNQSSPYIHSFIKTLQTAGHIVSVVLPHEQKSWIGKAHFVGQLTKPTYFRPGTLHKDDGQIYEKPLAREADEEEWVLVNGTPATCTQLGLYHFFQDRGPVDLVVSGPNYGRNSTALFSLSSGTIGGAMEAAVCRKKAIAISYAFYSRDHDPSLIAAASRLSAKLIEHLYNNWGQDVDLYSINVPLVEGIEHHKVMYTNALQNYWSSGTSFQEVEANENNVTANSQEKEIREGGETTDGRESRMMNTRHKHRHFKWTPKFSDIQKSIEDSPPGNDGWAIKEGYSSVTPLKANFMHVPSISLGELKLPSSHELCSSSPVKQVQHPKIYALINYEDDYVQPLILQALKSQLPPSSYILINSLSELPSPSSPILQITSYETIDFEHLLAHPLTSLANSYIIRKALIRKHYLAHTVSSWLSKHPDSPLKDHVKPTLDFELDYAEFLDEALLEAYELHESFARNEDKEPQDREWWILKPSMSDRGQGIRLFSTEEELRHIFEEWEADSPNSDSDSESTERPTLHSSATTSPSLSTPPPPQNTAIITSQLRHFIAQPYIPNPLLLPTHQNRKFHLRTYALAHGALKIYTHSQSLALFAPTPYTPPGQTPTSHLNPLIHLTNTCLHFPPNQHQHNSPPLVQTLHTLPLPPSLKNSITSQLHTATGTIFLAAARTQSIHFQALPNAFEVFGLDWLVDAAGRVWLLEVNAFPDFGQTGAGLRGVVGAVWEGVVRVVVQGFFFGVGVGGRVGEVGGGEEVEGEVGGGEEVEGEVGGGEEVEGGEEMEGERGEFVKVLDVDLGRG